MNNTINTDGFSWHRVAMIARYAYPALKWQIISYPIAAVILSLLYVIAMATGIKSVNIASLSSLGISLMLYLAPLALANRDFRATIAMLPVTAGEKLAFLLIYALGYIFVVTTGLSCCINALFMNLLPPEMIHSRFLLEAYREFLTPGSFAMGVLISWGFQVFCLYGVVTARSSRMGKGLLFTALGFGIYMVSSMIGGIWGTIRYIEAHPDMQSLTNELGVHGAASSEQLIDSLSPEAMSEMITFVKGIVSPLYGLMGAVAIICIIVLLIKLYKKLRTGGF